MVLRFGSHKCTFNFFLYLDKLKLNSLRLFCGEAKQLNIV